MHRGRDPRGAERAAAGIRDARRVRPRTGSRRARACSTPAQRSRPPASRPQTLYLGGLELAPLRRARALRASAARSGCGAGASRGGRPPRTCAAPAGSVLRGSSARPVPAEAAHAGGRGQTVLELDAVGELSSVPSRRLALELGDVRPSRPRTSGARAGAPGHRRSSAAARRSCRRRAGRRARRAPGGRRGSTTVGRPCGSLAVVTTPGRLVQEHVGEPLLRERLAVEPNVVVALRRTCSAGPARR